MNTLCDNKKDITLIIPAAGKSSRYPNMRPKWMLTHPDGKMMIEKVLEEFGYKGYRKTCVAILREHCIEFEADLVLKQAFGESIEVLILESPTKSCPETIYKTIQDLKIKGRIIIKDTDCIVSPETIINENFVVGMSIDESSSVKKIQNKSFVVKNDDNIIQDIVEKSIVSSNICLGVYCLLSEEFLSAYSELVNSNLLFEKNELYISHIISHLILNNKFLFQFISANKYSDWGTLKEWQEEREKYSTYIFDIDGVMLFNYGKHGSKNWSNTFEPILENINLVKSLYDSGNEIIFMTARGEKYLEKFRKYIDKIGIYPKAIIYDCNHSRRILVNDFAITNPYPSCEAISIKRNSSLSDYMTISNQEK